MVTRVVPVTNRSALSERFTPAITIPAGWSVPLGLEPFDVAGGRSEQWILSVWIPARAPAGRHSIAVMATTASGTVIVRDTLVVVVKARRALELAMTSRASYAVVGSQYTASFLVRNRGNVRSTVMLSGVSSLGGAVVIDSARVTLEPAASRTIAVLVTAVMQEQKAHDDVLELHAVDVSDATVNALASARVTVVQRANAAEPLHRVATQLRLRAADASAGVSRFELIGGGALRDGGAEQLAFVLRGPAGPASPFGDRDEYRVELRGARYTARAGDALYRASNLTSNGQLGFGGGLDVTAGPFALGGFAQRFRMQRDGALERGGYASVRGDSVFARPQLTVSGVSRTGGPLAGRILSTGAALYPLRGATVELEAARSSGPLGEGSARMARISGGDRLHYDAGHAEANGQFAGLARGTRHDFASVSGSATHELQLSATASAHRAQSATLGRSVSQRTKAATVEMAYQSRFTLQYSNLGRMSEFSLLPLHETQHGVLARVEQALGRSRLWGSAGIGSASSGSYAQRYHELTLGGSATIGSHALSLYGETSEGMSITRGSDRLLTIGGDARLRLNAATALTAGGFSTRAMSGSARYSQIDGALSRQLARAGTVTLRVRVAGNRYISAPAKPLIYMEYATPLKLPIGRTSTPGRVRGEVVDQATGRGMANVLVRLGPQAALTDAEGRVAFAGLPAGEYRLVLAQRTSAAPTVFTGNATVHVDSERHAPVTFRVAVERAAQIGGTVHRMLTVRTGIGSAPDSLGDGGPMAGVDIILMGARDTLYASSSGAGTFAFPEVPSGQWTLRVLTSPQAGSYWAPAEIEVAVGRGAWREIAVRQLPRRRAVQMIDGNAPEVRP